MVNDILRRIQKKLVYVRAVNSNGIEFTKPELSLGQKVRTRTGYVGYIVGIDFYPEDQTWVYGLHPGRRNDDEPVERDFWLSADELEVFAND
ncbi:MAG: hypothetical protein WBA10_09575 [Elainellaceae cyanobacterium]